MIMNAGASPTGQSFAIRNCDALFSNADRATMDDWGKHVQRVKAQARENGRELDVYTVGVITCRPSEKEARDYYHHCVIEKADWRAVDNILAMKDITPQTHPKDFIALRNHRANGMGGLPIVGDPDQVAGELAQLAQAGFTGLGVSLVNYAEELPYFCAEVLPRLQRMGLREKPAQ
jgi:alkanesulfonate monooxygenase SsuD/methylene tetrahydromethanopterin reductase-like flavin-dependent oxidoreductase (luciferase family)